MPLVASFQVDHTIMPAPSVRRAKCLSTPHGDTVEVWDLRFYAPNRGLMDPAGMHSLEHLFADYMRRRLSGERVEVIDISPMGCRTGFYMSVIGTASAPAVAAAMQQALLDIAALPAATPVPAANVHQCGTAELHSLFMAQQICNDVLAHDIGVVRNEDISLSEQQLSQL